MGSPTFALSPSVGPATSPCGRLQSRWGSFAAPHLAKHFVEAVKSGLLVLTQPGLGGGEPLSGCTLRILAAAVGGAHRRPPSRAGCPNVAPCHRSDAPVSRCGMAAGFATLGHGRLLRVIPLPSTRCQYAIAFMALPCGNAPSSNVKLANHGRCGFSVTAKSRMLFAASHR